ncbi:transposase [Endomicrobium sp. AH-315-J14]|nr:transposase [Endomicrobium sp. AH-315-J14]
MLNFKMAARRKRVKRRGGEQLTLSGRGSHGGIRRGAGRPRGLSGAYIPHIKRARVTKHTPVHVTIKVVAGLPNLRRNRPTGRIKRIFRAEKNRKGFRLVHFVIMEDHLHLICEANSTQAMSRGIQRISSRAARSLNKLFKRRGRLFADRFHDHVMKKPREVRNVLRYVLLNTQKDTAKQGLFYEGIDGWSSGAWFDGWKDIQPRPPPDEDPPVTEAKSYLLSKLWRRHGLIRSDEKWLEVNPGFVPL